ncbi:TetR/AcrR family transcriptional regulator [Limnochorda pilosa]|uniref:TetR family transcriptional regulator n=1 Tax=Limnochorda pilosa TaxID=1555112 RepID=A0A0K2SJM6_LIMPI|nr:TetR/AcrR family transcriptional regulator [Limnochorda pilosa]BAS27295.1 TetR family transcriptional regulator [Limnochorda pilosa]
MSDRVDRRKSRTRRLLRQALVELIDEEGLDRITVSSLCERADINRGTFYLHYRDIYDFIERNTVEVLEGLRKLVDRADPFELLAYAAQDETYPQIVAILEYLTQHAAFFKAMLGPKGDPAFPAQIKELMASHLFPKLFSGRARPSELLIPPDYLIAFATSAQLGLIQHWFDTGMAHSPSELALFISRIVFRGPAAVVGLL